MGRQIKQNRSFQEQLWQQQREKFTERKDRWMEVTGYIFNRGNRDWSIKMSEFNQQWLKWRFETRKEIEAGESWWLEQDRGMREEMGKWSEEASNLGSKTAVEKMYQELEGRVSGYEKKMRGNIPGSGNFNIDTDAILKNALSSIPEMSIGVLNNSMSAVDTTAGLSNMLNLGLNGSLFIHNEKEMAAYEQAYSVMQNMRVLDILNAILEGFGEQLKGANESLYEAVETGIARTMPYAVASFQRDESSREWKIKVCVASNLTGDKFKTRRFTDYKDYENSTVFLKPLKGIGQEIDFTKPSSYINIDKEELDVYVGLAGEFLNRVIEEVFKDGGYFSGHQESEFDRIGGRFGKYYQQWEAGEALRSAGFYSKPMFPNGPNMLNVATMAAGFAGGPWAAFAMSTLATGIQVADGSMDWKQGAFQVGISGATALIGVGAGELGAMLGGASSAATQAAAETATKSLTQVITENVVRTAGNTLLSGVTLEGGKLGYDKDKMKNWKTWAGAGITAAAGSITGSMNLSGLSSSLVTGVGSSLNSGLTTGNWADSFKQGAITSIGNYIGNSIAGGMTGEGGLNTSNEYTKQLISNYTTFAARKLLGSDEKFDMNTIGNVDTISMVINQTYSGIKSSRQAEYEKANRDRLIESGLSPEEVERTLRDAGTAETGAKAADRFKDPLAGLDMALSGVFVSLGRGLGQTMNQIGESIKSGAEAVWSGVKDVAASAWSGVTGAVSSVVGAVGTFAERTGNWFTEGHFVSDAEVKQIREQERIKQEHEQQEILKGNKPAGMSDAEFKQKFREAEQRAKDSELANNWRDKVIDKIEENEMGYLKGYQRWVKGDGYNNISMVQGDDGEYYAVKRMVNPKNGTITVVGEPARIADEDTINQFKKEVKNPTTWCNYAANGFAQEAGAPSLVYRSDLGEFGATKLAKYLENGTLNNTNGRFLEITNHTEASNFASQGNLVLMVGSGHVAAVTGGYTGDSSLKNLNIYQAGTQDRNTGSHMFGGMRAVDGWGNKNIRTVKMYTWRPY